jgi:hypothetical protein
LIGNYGSVPAGSNAAGGIDFDCADNLISTGDALLSGSPPPVKYIYGLQITPKLGNTVPITNSSYFIDLDGFSTPQSKNRIGDVAVRRDCCNCAEVTVSGIQCDTFNPGNFNVTLSVTNHTGTLVNYLLITPSAGTFTVGTPSPIMLTPALANGLTTTVTVNLGGVKSGGCLKVSLVGFSFANPSHEPPVRCCCSVEVCIPALPPCDCMAFRCDSVTPVPGSPGVFSYSFCVTNLTANLVEDIYLYPPPGVTITPTHFDVSLPPNTSFCGTVTISGATPGTQLCFGITLNDQRFEECCAQRHCIVLPGGHIGGTGD